MARTYNTDSSQFTKEELDKIVRAFFDVADSIDTNNFEAQTGESDPAAQQNFGEARTLIYKRIVG